MQGVRLCPGMHVLALLLLLDSLSGLCSHVYTHGCLTNTHSCLSACLCGIDHLVYTAAQSGKVYNGFQIDMHL